jgi:hypothetical protein
MPGTSPKPFVFILMPFEAAFDDAYQLGIKVACKEAGAYCERVDEQIFQESILERIYNQIAKADIVVADMTGRNENVFYEVGYAHAIGKRTILLTQKAEDIPFDLKHYPHIIYGGSITSLKDDLKKRVKWYIDNPERMRPVVAEELEFYVNGQNLKVNPNLTLTINLSTSWTFFVDLHNPSDRIIDLPAIELGFVFPAEMAEPAPRHESSRLPDSKYMPMLRDLRRLLPKSWLGVSFYLTPTGKGTAHGCKFVSFTEMGARELEFTMWLQYERRDDEPVPF